MKKNIKLMLLVVCLTLPQLVSAWDRGQKAYVCIKVPGVQCLFQWGFGCGYESCEVRVVDVGSSSVNVEFVYQCGMGFSAGNTKWMENDQLFSGNKCNDYLD